MKYIKENLKNGFSEDIIRTKLLSSGYPKEVVEKGFEDAKKSPLPAVLILLLFLIIGAAAIIYNIGPIREYLNKNPAEENPETGGSITLIRSQYPGTYYYLDERCFNEIGTSDISNRECLKNLTGREDLDFCGLYVSDTFYTSDEKRKGLVGKIIISLDQTEIQNYTHFISLLRGMIDTSDGIIVGTMESSVNLTFINDSGRKVLGLNPVSALCERQPQ